MDIFLRLSNFSRECILKINLKKYPLLNHRTQFLI